MRALFALAWSALALAQASSVDWERRVIRCGGAGAPSLREAADLVAVTRVGAERAAKRETLRSCMAALRGVAVETGRTAAQVLDADSGVAAAVESAVKRARSGSERRFFSDGGVELRVEVPLDGEISELLLSAVRPSPAKLPAGGRADVTGVLLDASALAISHALAPRILDPAGAEVYGASVLSARARRGGTAAYASDLASARRTFAARLGPAPRVVSALRADGPDVVVSESDADAIRGCPCLSEGRVVIVARGRP
jgi:hypothetical protein